MLVIACSRAIPPLLAPSPSRQTASQSRRPLTTIQCGCRRRRQGRAAACLRAILTPLGPLPSRQTASQSRRPLTTIQCGCRRQRRGCAAACSRAILTPSAPSPSRQMASQSRRPLATTQCGCGRRRRGRAAACLRAILTSLALLESALSPSRQTASIFKQIEVIFLYILLLRYYPYYIERSRLISLYKTSRSVQINSSYYSFLLSTN